MDYLVDKALLMISRPDLRDQNHHRLQTSTLYLLHQNPGEFDSIGKIMHWRKPAYGDTQMVQLNIFQV